MYSLTNPNYRKVVYIMTKGFVSHPALLPSYEREFLCWRLTVRTVNVRERMRREEVLK